MRGKNEFYFQIEFQMILVIDQLIKGIQLPEKGVQLIALPALKITNQTLVELKAKALLVRSVTKVNSALLQDTDVHFVGTVTSGTDHIDIPWLEKNKITWVNAPGANAHAVVEYIVACVAALIGAGIIDYPTQIGRAGIIGMGTIGSKVREVLLKLGYQVVVNDPPKAASFSDFSSTSLENFRNLDLICVHAELTRSGPFPSYHLLTDAFFKQQKAGCVLINAARGGIIATEVLLKSPHLYLCLDVWEQEPIIDKQLLSMATIATPHIAGYSYEAKERAVDLIQDKMASYFNWPIRSASVTKLKTDQTNDFPHSINLNNTKNWVSTVQSCFNLIDHTRVMKREIRKYSGEKAGKTFESLRQPFACRHEFLNSE